MLQTVLFDTGLIKKVKKSNPLKPEAIHKNILMWNTVPHIYRYQTLFKICEKIFNLTYEKRLICLNYYIDVEKDNNITYTVMYAEIKDSSSLSLKERVLKHIDLLRKIRNNDNSLEYGESPIISSDMGTLFG